MGNKLLWMAFILFMFIYLFLIFWLRHAACGILVPQPGIKSRPPALEVQSPTYWTTREVPLLTFKIQKFVQLKVA